MLYGIYKFESTYWRCMPALISWVRILSFLVSQVAEAVIGGRGVVRTAVAS